MTGFDLKKDVYELHCAVRTLRDWTLSHETEGSDQARCVARIREALRLVAESQVITERAWSGEQAKNWQEAQA